MTVVSICILSLVFIILIYVNTIFYAMVVVVSSILSLYILVLAGVVSLLAYLFIIIVYVGAVMIFVGYVCAVCPNFIIIKTQPTLTYFIFIFLLYLLIERGLDLNPLKVVGDRIFRYFYSAWGGRVLVGLIFILFLVLLIVTSQFSQPKGPFRSS